jgi:hypothetical protein
MSYIVFEQDQTTFIYFYTYSANAGIPTLTSSESFVNIFKSLLTVLLTFISETHFLLGLGRANFLRLFTFTIVGFYCFSSSMFNEPKLAAG